MPDHQPGRRHRLVRAATTAAAFGAPFVVLALVVRTEAAPVVAWDEAAVRAATDLTRKRPALLAALLGWEAAFRSVWVNAAVSAVCLWAWRRHGLRTRAQWAFVTLMVGWGLQLAAKGVVQRTRPVVEDAVALSSGFSFPSGHAANTASAMTVLTVLLWPLLGRRGRVLVPALCGCAVLLTAADRVLLGVHYPSDVVAGVLFGVGVATASFVGYRGSTPTVHATHARAGAPR